MYICLDCGNVFENPIHYTETHGLDSPPYEKWDGCPNCAGVFTEAFKCHNCGDWVRGQYIVTDDGLIFCENCYSEYELGEQI